MKIGITGGIGTGKSAVSKILREKGYIVVDADKISRDVMNDNNIIDKLISAFGVNILENNQEKKIVSRKKLSSVVFNNKEKLNELDNIMHLEIIKIMKDQVTNAEKEQKIVFAEVPLLFELGLEKYFDKTLTIYTSRQMQIERIQKRDNRTLEETENIINSQMDIDVKKQKSDYIIDNSGNLEELEKKIDIFLNN